VLRTIGAIWQQDALEQNARQLLELGKELYARLTTLGSHTSAMGQSLAKAVEQYNRFVGTLESRVLVTARRMHELDLESVAPPELTPVVAGPRALSAVELTLDAGGPRRDQEFLEAQAGSARESGARGTA
jgi:DNA recombination protein RmuC